MNQDIKLYPKIKGLYKHYKGSHYLVITMAKHSETNESLVIYKSIEFNSFHARPLDEWNKDVEAKIEGGRDEYELIERFKLIS